METGTLIRINSDAAAYGPPVLKVTRRSLLQGAALATVMGVLPLGGAAEIRPRRREADASVFEAGVFAEGVFA